jgi:hypothetical protein
MDGGLILLDFVMIRDRCGVLILSKPPKSPIISPHSAKAIPFKVPRHHFFPKA